MAATDLFSVKDYETILENCYKTNEIKYVRAELFPLSEDAEGFMGEHLKLKLTGKVDGIEIETMFFIKTKPMKKLQSQSELLDTYNIYDREIFCYDYFLKEFAKYGFDTSFAAKCYHCIPGQTLVLEDLSSQGYQLFQRNIPYSHAEIKHLLDALALLHAAGYAYEKEKSEELGKLFRITDDNSKYFEEVMFALEDELTSDCFASKWWKSSRKTIGRLIDLLPEDETFKTNFQILFDKYKIGKSFYEKTNISKTFGHGDLWSNNMMFQFKGNIAEKCCLLDFQIYRYFYPTFDVVLAIYLNTTREFRQIYLDDLHNHYYNFLSQTIKNYGYLIENIFPKHHFHESIKLVKVDALSQVTTALALVNLPKDTLNNSAQEEETFNKFLYDNDELAVQAYKNSDVVQKVINSSLYDLYEALQEDLK